MWRDQNNEDFQWLEQFLKNYQLRLEFFEDYGKVKKVYTNNGIFGVKTIPGTKGIDFIKNVQSLYQSGYNRIAPIFTTTDNRYGVLMDGNVSYLMPWLPDEVIGERSERHKQMFRELARMHTLSVKDKPITKDEREEHYEETKERWEKQQEFLKEFVQGCEKKWYMSPFELQYCTYYYDISQAITYSLKKFDAWYEATKEEEKVRTVVTHGNVSIHHFLYSENGYGHFINFENSKVVPPHFDLLPFIVKQLKTYPAQSDEIVEWIYTYFKFFPFKEGEMLLFSSYLAHPENCLKIVEKYYRKQGQLDELKFCRKLQKQYWLLKNIEYIVMRIEQIEEGKKEAIKQENAPSS